MHQIILQAGDVVNIKGVATSFVIGCQKHPRYKAIRVPVSCKDCREVFRAVQWTACPILFMKKIKP